MPLHGAHGFATSRSETIQVYPQNNQVISVTLSIPILRAQFTNHAISKYPHLLGILPFKVFN
jgi:hypothetical protein